MTTQENCVETKKETNSMYEESDVMTWWRNAWWVRMDNGPHLRTVWRAAMKAAGNARDRKVAGGEREEWETRRKANNTNVHTLYSISHCNKTATAPATTTTTVAITTAVAAMERQRQSR